MGVHMSQGTLARAEYGFMRPSRSPDAGAGLDLAPTIYHVMTLHFHPLF